MELPTFFFFFFFLSFFSYLFYLFFAGYYPLPVRRLKFPSPHHPPPMELNYWICRSHFSCSSLFTTITGPCFFPFLFAIKVNSQFRNMSHSVQLKWPIEICQPHEIAHTNNKQSMWWCLASRSKMLLSCEVPFPCRYDSCYSHASATISLSAIPASYQYIALLRLLHTSCVVSHHRYTIIVYLAMIPYYNHCN